MKTGWYFWHSPITSEATLCSLVSNWKIQLTPNPKLSPKIGRVHEGLWESGPVVCSLVQILGALLCSNCLGYYMADNAGGAMR